MSNETVEIIDVEGEEVEASSDVSLEVVERQVDTYTPAKVLGGIPHFHEYLQLADEISRTAMVPTTLRGKPQEVLAVVMYGAELGIGPMQALQQINFIEGKPSMAPELMRALIRQAGHKLQITQTNTKCVIVGIRGDTGEEGETEFTIEDAVSAGLCTIDADGKVRARSSNGHALPWEKYTRDMLLARATTRIGRLMFSDVIAGMSYSPEEIQSFSEESEPKSIRRSSSSSNREKKKTETRQPPTHEVELISVERYDAIVAQIQLLTKDERQEFMKWGKVNGAIVTDSQLGSILNKNMTEEFGIEVERRLFDVLNAEPEFHESAHESSSDDENRKIDVARKNPDELALPLASERQTKMIWGMSKDAGREGDAAHEWVSHVVGRIIKSFKELTKAEASKVIDQLNADERIEPKPYRGKKTSTTQRGSREFAPDNERF